MTDEGCPTVLALSQYAARRTCHLHQQVCDQPPQAEVHRDLYEAAEGTDAGLGSHLELA